MDREQQNQLQLYIGTKEGDTGCHQTFVFPWISNDFKVLLQVIFNVQEAENFFQYEYKRRVKVRENRRDNQECTIQKHWQHWVHKTQSEDKQNKIHNIVNSKDEQQGSHQTRGLIQVLT